MEPMKGGHKAYVLLREALKASGKIGIARVVIKTREHLAAVKPQERGLMLELMHFAAELINVDEFKLPEAKTLGKSELRMADQLIKSMAAKWDPDAFVDDYRAGLEKLIEEKVKKGGRQAPGVATPHHRKATNVIDLVSVLRKSIEQSGKKARPSASRKRKAA